jgi:hypothetical protein
MNQSILTYCHSFISAGFTTGFDHFGLSSDDTKRRNIYILLTELFINISINMDPY